MTNSSRSVVVVGAGVFGITGATELARRGWSVTVVDAGPIPHPEAASTDVSKVVRIDYGADDFFTRLGEEALAGWGRWNAQFHRPLFHEVGFLVLAGAPLAPGTFEYESICALERAGYQVQRLNDPRVRRRFPSWSRELYPDGYYNPRGGWVESGQVIEVLLRRAQALGVTVRTGAAASEILGSNGGYPGVVLTDGSRVEATQVLVAAGAQTPSLLPELGDVMWASGHPVLYFSTPAPERLGPPGFVPWAADISRTGWYGFPALRDGTLKVANHGPGRRLDPREPRVVAPEEEPRFREFLGRALPDLADLPLTKSRLCLYCDTFDGDFWIDRHPTREGVSVAAGGSGHGFKFAPVLGDLVADAVEGKRSRWSHRFLWRERGPDRFEAARAGRR